MNWVECRMSAWISPCYYVRLTVIVNTLLRVINYIPKDQKMTDESDALLRKIRSAILICLSWLTKNPNLYFCNRLYNVLNDLAWTLRNYELILEKQNNSLMFKIRLFWFAYIIFILKALVGLRINRIKQYFIVCNNHQHQYYSECSLAQLRETWENTYEPLASHVGLGTMWNAMETFYGPTFSDPHCIFMLTSSDFTGFCVISKLLYRLWWNERFPIIAENSGFTSVHCWTAPGDHDGTGWCKKRNLENRWLNLYLFKAYN